MLEGELGATGAGLSCFWGVGAGCLVGAGVDWVAGAGVVVSGAADAADVCVAGDVAVGTEVPESAGSDSLWVLWLE